MMLHSQYLRLESRAGGVSCTPREFIRVCRAVCSKTGLDREHRELRQAWICSGLEQRDNARNQYCAVLRGN